MDETCELPLQNATSEEIRDILSAAKVVAVVGLSNKPERDSYGVAAYLQAHGYHIVPINPNINQVLGERAYPTSICTHGAGLFEARDRSDSNGF